MTTSTNQASGFKMSITRVKTSKLGRIVNNHIVLFVLASIALCFVFGKLDNAYLSIGESNTAQLGSNILQFGYPKVWDGRNLVVPFYDSAINGQFAWITHPWLQYYLAAGGIALFGQNSVGARFFFGVSGLLAIIAIYYLALEMSASLRLARITTLVLALHPVFWLYSRQSRYYAPTMLLMVLTTLAYLKWRRLKDRRHLALFILSAILLFHSHYPIWGFLMLAIGVYYLVFDCSRENIARFAVAAIAIAVFTLPWFLYAPPHFHYDQPLTLAGYGTRVLVHLWKIQVLYFPLLTLGGILAGLVLLARVRGKTSRDSRLQLRKEYWLLVSVPGYMLFILGYPFYATHYLLAAIPFGAIVVGHLLAKIREQSRWVAGAVLATLLATNFLHIFPYVVVDKLGVKPATIEAGMPNPMASMFPGTPLSHYLSEQLRIRFYPFDFYDFIRHEYQHQMKAVVAYLREYGRKGETVYAPWNDANTLAFYTGLKVSYNLDTPFIKNPNLKSVVSLTENDKPDWIVPLSIDLPPNYYLAERFYRDYERISVACPKEYFETYPNIEVFNFRTNREAPSSFYLLRAKKE